MNLSLHDQKVKKRKYKEKEPDEIENYLKGSVYEIKNFGVGNKIVQNRLKKLRMKDDHVEN